MTNHPTAQRFPDCTAPPSLPEAHLAARYPPDHSSPSSLLDTLRSVGTLLTRGHSPSSWLRATLSSQWWHRSTTKTSTLTEVWHLSTGERYLSAYEPYLFSRGAAPSIWEQHLSVCGACQLFCDTFWLMFVVVFLI